MPRPSPSAQLWQKSMDTGTIMLVGPAAIELQVNTFIGMHWISKCWNHAGVFEIQHRQLQPNHDLRILPLNACRCVGRTALLPTEVIYSGFEGDGFLSPS